ncbi:MAG: fluoride efflux transporter CrcB [Planctomycetota bacterium]
MQLLLIGVGGFVGAISRYGVGVLVKRLAGESVFPYGTLVANVIGCFLMGCLVAWGGPKLDPNLRATLGVGFLGALTTFSTFGNESVSLAQSGQMGVACANVGLNVALSLAGVYAGLSVGKLFA